MKIKIMDSAVAALAAAGEADCLRSSWLLLKVVHNLLQHPEDPRYQRIRATTDAVRALLAMPGVTAMLAHLGFVDEGEFFVLPAPDPVRLAAAFDALTALRRTFDSIEALELFAVRLAAAGGLRGGGGGGEERFTLCVVVTVVFGGPLTRLLDGH